MFRASGTGETPVIRGLHQPLQGLEVYGVPVAAGFVFFLGGFQDLGDVLPALVADDGFETFEADRAFADVVVAVYSAAEFLLGIVEVEDLDAIKADGGFDLLDELGVFSAAKVVAGGEEVGGVEADGEAVGVFGEVDDGGEVFEAVAQAGALASGDFQARDHLAFADADVNKIKGGGDAFETGFFSTTDVSTGVRDEIGDAQEGAAGEFFDEEVDALLPEGVVGGGEVDQVAVVADGLGEAEARTVGFPGVDNVGLERLGFPLLLVLGEDLCRVEAETLGVEQSVVHATGD
jgi:hypothetical protein